MRPSAVTTIAILLGFAAGGGAQEAPRPKILGVAHIAIFAADYEKSRSYYHDFLGFEEPYSLAKPDGTPSMTFFKVNERQYIELFPETTPKSDRLNHISIETDDAEAMRKYLASFRIAVPKAVGKGRIGNSNFNIKDPDGHTVEIVQYEPDGWTVREKGKHMTGLHRSLVRSDRDRQRLTQRRCRADISGAAPI